MESLTFTVRPLSNVLSADALGTEGSLVDRIYTVLRRAIIDLSLPPDLPLVEQDVATALQTSKTPVREAIIRLAREGLVDVVAKSGSYVTPISIERYLEACFVRMQLEVGCVRRLASLRISLADQVRLRAFIVEQEAAFAANDDARFFAADEAMHYGLFELAGLPGVWRTMNLAKAELDRVRHLKRRFGNRQRQLVIEEHRVLIEAIIAGDPAVAERALLDNIGAVDEEIASLARHPGLLRTIDDLNALVALEQRQRGSRTTRKAS
jgi:DNA-binding GntR family transcriptional regulator